MILGSELGFGTRTEVEFHDPGQGSALSFEIEGWGRVLGPWGWGRGRGWVSGPESESGFGTRVGDRDQVQGWVSGVNVRFQALGWGMKPYPEPGSETQSQNPMATPILKPESQNPTLVPKPNLDLGSQNLAPKPDYDLTL
ncbi:hypothetical protein TIFTF001_003909 [Ficus carica]|uniref:Uncharacterized protein n=1 Tax=Ficus carica TaxID=3494 RepID=A0AA87ZB46_FICCA|nr:hypothetical protein TIFTF001_003909 [Ficus carica]